jgi:hypothetical protein
MYVGLVRLRGGVRVVTIDRDLGDVIGPEDVLEGDALAPGPGRHHRHPSLPVALHSTSTQWVVFSTEYCAVCPAVVAEIESRRPGDRVVVLDVAENLDLASRYRVRRAPTVLRAEPDGSVVARLSGVDAVRAELATAPAAV